MIELKIPGYKHLRISEVAMDVNGTLALDGTLIAGVKLLLDRLRQQVNLHMLTANTHGKQDAIDAILGMKAHIITRGAVEKAEYVQKLGAEHVIAIGNGANDAWMCEVAALGIAVIGPEGAAASVIRSADVVVRDIRDALEMMLWPQRLRATLRR